MNKRELVELVAKNTRSKKSEVEKILDAATNAIQRLVANGDDVLISGFGTFSLAKRKARGGFDPHSGKQIKIPELKLPKFKAGKDFKKAVEERQKITKTEDKIANKS